MSLKSGLQLVVLDGPEPGRVIVLEGKNLKLSRTPGKDTLVLDHEEVGSPQFSLKWEGGQKGYLLAHQARTGSTSVNGHAVDKLLLKPGDRIAMGSVLLELQKSDTLVPPRKPSRSIEPEKQECPRDGHRLNPAELPNNALGMDCSKCRGLWLPAGQLGRIHGHTLDFKGAIPVQTAGQEPRCPGCDLAMGLIYLPNSGGLEVLQCRSCLGLWLDTGGLLPALDAARRLYSVPTPQERLESEDRSVLLQRLKRHKEETLAQEAPSPGRSQADPLNQLLSEAVTARASSIHIDSQGVRLRVDGHLRPHDQKPDGLVSRLQALGHQFTTTVNEVPCLFQVATAPTGSGWACVVHLQEQRLLGLDELGFQADDLELLTEALARPQGMILLSGRGRRTTHYAILHHLAGSQSKVVSIEDSVSFPLDEVVQLAPGLGSAEALRAALRLDADAILVAELADLESAQLALRAALKGHLVVAGLCAQGSVEAWLRLIEMGCPPYLVKEAVCCSCTQRLVRLLCPACKVAGRNPEVDGTVFHAGGCEQCGGTGYQGRSALAEVVFSNSAVQEAIYSDQPVARIREKSGLRSLRDNALEKVRSGLTSLDEVRAYLAP